MGRSKAERPDQTEPFVPCQKAKGTDMVKPGKEGAPIQTIPNRVSHIRVGNCPSCETNGAGVAMVRPNATPTSVQVYGGGKNSAVSPY